MIVNLIRLTEYSWNKEEDPRQNFRVSPKQRSYKGKANKDTEREIIMVDRHKRVWSFERPWEITLEED